MHKAPLGARFELASSAFTLVSHFILWIAVGAFIQDANNYFRRKFSFCAPCPESKCSSRRTTETVQMIAACIFRMIVTRRVNGIISNTGDEFFLLCMIHCCLRLS